MSRQVKCEAEGDEGREKGDPRRELAGVRQEKHDECSSERGDEDEREDDIVHCLAAHPYHADVDSADPVEAHCDDCEKEDGCCACGEPSGVGAEVA